MTIVRTKTPSGEAIVILPEVEFERLRELAEDTLDARLVDGSSERLRAGADELLTEADLDALRMAPSPLAFWRARRGMSISQLAQSCTLSEGEVTMLDQGTDTAGLAVYERLARILDVDVEDLVPDAH